MLSLLVAVVLVLLVASAVRWLAGWVLRLVLLAAVLVSVGVLARSDLPPAPSWPTVRRAAGAAAVRVGRAIADLADAAGRSAR